MGIFCLPLLLTATLTANGQRNLVPDGQLELGGWGFGLWAKTAKGPEWGTTYGRQTDVLRIRDQELSVDTRPIAGLGMAVLWVPVGQELLRRDAEYVFRCEARADEDAALVALSPEQDWGGPPDTKQANSQWFAVGRGWTALEAEFRYQPGINQDQVGLFIDAAQAGRVFTLRRFELVRLGQ